MFLGFGFFFPINASFRHAALPRPVLCHLWDSAEHITCATIKIPYAIQIKDIRGPLLSLCLLFPSPSSVSLRTPDACTSLPSWVVRPRPIRTSSPLGCLITASLSVALWHCFFGTPDCNRHHMRDLSPSSDSLVKIAWDDWGYIYTCNTAWGIMSVMIPWLQPGGKNCWRSSSLHKLNTSLSIGVAEWCTLGAICINSYPAVYNPFAALSSFHQQWETFVKGRPSGWLLFPS